MSLADISPLVPASMRLHLCLQLNERSSTPEGFEASFATNTLGTAALTAQLLPALTAAAPSRVIIVSSGGMYTGVGWNKHSCRKP